MEINTLLPNFHRWTAIFCPRQSNSNVVYLNKLSGKKIIFRLRFSTFRILILVALCCSLFMSKGSNENLIKYFIFLSSQVYKYWSGRLHKISKFSSETEKNSYMQWDSSCIIITFQSAVLCWKVQKLQQLGVSVIGNIASFALSNGNILLLLLLLLFIIIIIIIIICHQASFTIASYNCKPPE